MLDGIERVRTKIIATVGPACDSAETLAGLVEAGVDVFRINMAHGSRSYHDEMVTRIRQLSDEIDQPLGILVDLAGPKIRLGELHGGQLNCSAGQTVRLVRGESAQQPDELVSNYSRLVDELGVGDQVLLADGLVRMVVQSKSLDDVRCFVENNGVVRSRQGINLPGVALSVPAITEEDRSNIEWAVSREIDFLGLSFVRSSHEIHALKAILNSHGSEALVIAKIEKAEAMADLEAIVDAADTIMVARGDLGVEIDVAETPVAQKKIINECRRQYKPVIVATQMLDSMHHSPRPTRAEATDVANAIVDGADACMLSGETAIGDYPLETVQMMSRIMLATESMLVSQQADVREPVGTGGIHKVTAAIVYGACRIVSRLNAPLMVVATRSSGTARVKSKQRNFTATVGVSVSETALRRMTLLWGITPLRGAPVTDGPALRDFIANWGKRRGLLKARDMVVFVTGTEVVPSAHNILAIHEVE